MQIIPRFLNHMEKEWKMKWKLGYIKGRIGFQVYKQCINGALKSVNIAYIGLFGFLQYLFNAQQKTLTLNPKP